MCEPGKDNSVEREIWHAMSVLMGEKKVLPGAEHAYEHLLKAHEMAWKQEHPEA